MLQIDAFGRPTPTDIQISRAAARRHEHLAALERAPGATRRALSWSRLGRPWSRLVTDRSPATVRAVRTARPTQVR
jgi:hypothetical protein